MEQNEVVVHHNNLTESIFSFNELELNTFIVLIYKLRNGNRKAVFNIKDIKSLINSKNRSLKRFETIMGNLFNTTINIKTNSGYKLKHFFEELDFDIDNKTISIEVKKEFEWLVYDLKERFTKYSLHEFVELKGAQSKRLFQLLKQYESIGKRKIEIDSLKKWLGAESYKRMYDFEKRVLTPSMENINKNTSINISYEKIKEGRNIKHIEFKIVKNNKTTSSNILEKKPNLKTPKNEVKILKPASRLRVQSENIRKMTTLTSKEFDKLLQDLIDGGMEAKMAERFLKIGHIIVD